MFDISQLHGLTNSVLKRKMLLSKVTLKKNRDNDRLLPDVDYSGGWPNYPRVTQSFPGYYRSMAAAWGASGFEPPTTELLLFEAARPIHNTAEPPPSTLSLHSA